MSKSPVRRHLPFIIGAAAGIAVSVVLWLVHPRAALVGGPITFFLIYLIHTATRIPMLTAIHMKTYAARDDQPAWIILIITIVAAAVAIASLFSILHSRDAADPLELTLSLATVALGWFTIHTMTALHYAHLYWRPEGDAKTKDKRHGGLEFPGGTEPGAYDFLYFAFVTGMTAQTSDVAITSTAMRKFNLIHGIVSFFFNTVLVAAAVNVVISLAS
jgi:uncharacterized membrane protein